MKTITLAHSDLTKTIYAIIGKEKIDITTQAIAEVKAIKALEQEPCEDCVSRQAVIEYIKDCNAELMHDIENESVREDILNMPSVIPTQRWIPVSERLPKEFVDVLCNTDSEEVFIATFLGKMNDGTNCFDDNDGMMWEGDVLAWQPLPEPYKESEE